MAAISKQEADAWDRVIDAADELANLIDSSGIVVGEYALEELTLFLAANSADVRRILRPVKRIWPEDDRIAGSPPTAAPTTGR
jgi:dsDNA-binding SOS-regulon protein